MVPREPERAKERAAKPPFPASLKKRRVDADEIKGVSSIEGINSISVKLLSYSGREMHVVYEGRFGW